MQNLFYVPPHQPRDPHPKPLGVRTVVKRNQPTRLDLTVPHTALVRSDLGRDTAPEPERRKTVAALRAAIGSSLIRLGTVLVPDESPHPGQPA